MQITLDLWTCRNLSSPSHSLHLKSFFCSSFRVAYRAINDWIISWYYEWFKYHMKVYLFERFIIDQVIVIILNKLFYLEDVVETRLHYIIISNTAKCLTTKYATRPNNFLYGNFSKTEKLSVLVISIFIRGVYLSAKTFTIPWDDYWQNERRHDINS